VTGVAAVGLAQPAAGKADKWIGRAAGVTVACLAGIAAAISYSHMLQLAQLHGQAGWHAHAFPLSVDGVEGVASLVLLTARRAGRRPGWLPWIALAIGTAGSLPANVATAGPDAVSRVIAGWPAVALLMAVKLLSGILEQRGSGTGPAGPGRGAARGQTGQAAGPMSPHGQRPASGRGAGSRANDDVTSRVAARPGTARPVDVGLLLPASRAARDALLQDGRPVTRDALASRLRQQGHTIGNARLTLVLQALRSEPIS